jgi:glycosyltransferase involved in cell wall biosynthesis
MTAKKKFLFVVDVQGWAYDDAALNWKELLKDKYDIDIIYLSNYVYKEEPIFNYKFYSGILFFYHRAILSKLVIHTKIPKDKLIICINNEKWKENGSKFEYEKYLSKSKILVVCNETIRKEFEGIHNNILRVSQAIDPEVFKIQRKNFVSNRINDEIIVGWSGKSKNPIKNVDLIKEACIDANVKLTIAENLARDDLNKWYNTLDMVICNSYSEGGPLLILEAGACGLPIITTSVGLVPEIIKNGENGIIIPLNNKEALINAIKMLSNDIKLRETIGKNLNLEITKNWTYKARLHEIDTVLSFIDKKII